jgi:adhesin HecA-like repeat protein
LTVTVGQRVANVDADIVRGPLSNLLVTGVTITSAPAVLSVGATGAFAASVVTTGESPEVFWTSLDPAVLTMADSVGTAVSAGTADVVASSGAFADTVSVSVTSTSGPPGGGTNTWIAQSGNWSSASNWSLGRPPAPADTVRLTQGSGYTVTLDISDTVAAVVIGASVTLSMGNSSLVMTGSGPGPELDILPSGILAITDGSITADGIRNAGTLRSAGFTILEADSVRNEGEWRAEVGAIVLGLLTTPWFETDSLVFVDVEAGIHFAPTSQVNYRDGTMEGAGYLLLQTGATLTLYRDLAGDSLRFVLQGASIVDNDAEDVTIGEAGFLELVSSATDSAVVRAGALTIDGDLFATGPQSRIRAPITITALGTLDVISSGAPARLTTQAVTNAGSIFLGGTEDVQFGPGASGVIANEVGAFLQTFTLASGSVVLDGQLENYGDVLIAGPTVLQREDAAGNPVSALHLNASLATLELTGTGSLHIALGGANPAPAFTNAGEITLEAGTTLSAENLANPPGQIIATSTAELHGEGTIDLTGAAAQMPNLTGANDGQVFPGLFGVGTLTWRGSLPMGDNGRIHVELDGITDHDRIDVSADLYADGDLNINLNYIPSPGDRLPILTFRDRFGAFDAVNGLIGTSVTLDTLWTDNGIGIADTLYVVATQVRGVSLNQFIGGPGANADDVDAPGNAVNLVATAIDAGSTALTSGGASPITFDFNTFGGVDRTSGFDRSDLLAVRADQKHDGTSLVLDLDNDGSFADEIAQQGFGLHANRFVTFDLDVVRRDAGLGSTQAFTLIGVAGPANALPSTGMSLAVLADGIPLVMHDVGAGASTSLPFSVSVAGSARYLTFAALDGIGLEPFSDHGGFTRVMLAY